MPLIASTSSAGSAARAASDLSVPGSAILPGADGTGPLTAMPAPDAQQQALAQFEHQGQIVEEYFPAVLLHTIAKRNLGNIVTAGGFKKFLDKFIADCGGPKNPVAKMLLEQTAWAHFAVGNLLAEAACAKTPELTATFTAIASRLMCEVRKTGLAVTELVSKEADDGASSGHAQDTDSNIELSSNAPVRPSHDKHSESDGSPNSGQVEPRKTKRLHDSRSSTAA